MTNPKVSVVIPCYNQVEYLREAISSVRNQTYRETKVIVVDDGSSPPVTDADLCGLDCMLIRQLNQGVSAARNAGLGACSSKFVTFLDADDRLVSSWLESAVDYLETNEACAFVYGHVRLIDQNGALIGIPVQEPVCRDHYETLLHRNYIWSPGCVVYRRDVVEEVRGFSVKRGGAADLDLNIRITRKFPVQCVDRAALEYRKHASSMSANNAKMLEDCMEVLSAQYAMVKGHPNLEAALQHGYGQVRGGYGRKATEHFFRELSTARWQDSARILKVLLRYYPIGFSKHAMRVFGNAVTPKWKRRLS